jgi:DNA-nicking Smr family endonuclease
VSEALKPEDLRLWAVVAATVKPARGRVMPLAPKPVAVHAPGSHKPPKPAPATATPAKPAPVRHLPPPGPNPIEPGRRRRLERERDPLAARIDLHGLTHDRARATLEAFLRRAQESGYRAALVITGKGRTGDGVIRRFAPEWLAAPALRGVVSGVSEAHRRHGGEGALYVALKRRD